MASASLKSSAIALLLCLLSVSPAAAARPPATALAALVLAVAPVPVDHAPCPGDTEYGGCYIPAPIDRIYINTNEPAYSQDVTMWHERGHAADSHFLVDGERHRFTCLPAVRNDDDASRCGHPWGPIMMEIWADAYASCHFRDLPSRGLGRWTGDITYWPKTDRRQVNACRFIQRAVAH